MHAKVKNTMGTRCDTKHDAATQDEATRNPPSDAAETTVLTRSRARIIANAAVADVPSVDPLDLLPCASTTSSAHRPFASVQLDAGGAPVYRGSRFDALLAHAATRGHL